MLTSYIEAALHKAVMERLADDESYYAEIPGFPGVWANGATPLDCLEQLREVLGDWLVIRLRKNAPIPDIDGLSLPNSEVVPA